MLIGRIPKISIKESITNVNKKTWLASAKNSLIHVNVNPKIIFYLYWRRNYFNNVD